MTQSVRQWLNRTKPYSLIDVFITQLQHEKRSFQTKFSVEVGLFYSRYQGFQLSKDIATFLYTVGMCLAIDGVIVGLAGHRFSDSQKSLSPFNFI